MASAAETTDRRPSKRARVASAEEPATLWDLAPDVWWCILPFLTPVDTRALLYTCKRLRDLLHRRASRTTVLRVRSLLADLGVPNALKAPVYHCAPWSSDPVRNAQLQAEAATRPPPSPRPFRGDPPPFGPDAILSGSFMWFALVEPRNLRLPRVYATARELLDAAGCDNPDNYLYGHPAPRRLTLGETGESAPDRRTDELTLEGNVFVHQRFNLITGWWRPCDIDIFCASSGQDRMETWLNNNGFFCASEESYDFSDGRGFRRVARFEALPCMACTITIQIILVEFPDGSAAAASAWNTVSPDALMRFDIPLLENAYDGRTVTVTRPSDVHLRITRVRPGVRMWESRAFKYMRRGIHILDAPYIRIEP